MFSDYACKINCSIPVNNVFRYFVINYNGKESEKQYTHTHTHTHTLPLIFFSIKVYHRILNIVPWAIQ